MEALQKLYHAGCFTCRSCQRALAGQRYYQRDGRPMCDTCYQVPTPPRAPPAPWGGWQEMQCRGRELASHSGEGAGSPGG